MINNSLTKKIIKDLNLKEDKNKKKILKICFKYLLGLDLYKNINKSLKKYKKNNQFCKLLKMLSRDYTDYIIYNLRSYAKYRHIVGYQVKIKKLDKKIINKLHNQLNYFKIVIPIIIISEHRLIEDFKPTVIKKSLDIYYRLRNDNSIDVQDLKSEFNIKIIQNFRLYVYCYKVKGFNKKMFLKCLHKGVTTKSIDILRYYFNKMRNLNKKIMYEEIINN